MSEAKFTKGPWKVGPVDDTRVEDALGNEVAQIDGDYNEPDTWPIMEANAHLIAAAPDLYEALRMAANDLNTAASLLPDIAPALLETVKQAHAALTKARGEA